ncbi:Transcriptional regulator ATRX [Strongyloides ratti]|uniref:Transcriptional regulator ATRX n=1 Tax=Strongyloides ratti TaxID=34506 RepID=A0A090MW92_STRRB|nr:Transcriptional regulator ATRX [Strongyloides ratti]CEF63543.1 Transcriptional regulator ATRX [Strongyloides ratti]
MLYDEDDEDEGVSNDNQDFTKNKRNFRLSIQRFLKLNEIFNISSAAEDTEKLQLYDEIKDEGENIIAYIKLLMKIGEKNLCVNSKKLNKDDRNNCNEEDSDSTDNESPSAGSYENFNTSNDEILRIIDDKGLDYSSDDEIDAVVHLPSASEDYIVNGDDIIQCTGDGDPDFSAPIKKFNKKRRRLSSSSSIEERNPPRKNYKLCDIDDEELNNYSKEIIDVSSDSSRSEVEIEKVYNSSESIETIYLSGDDEPENDSNLLKKKHQRKILTNNQLAQSTREAKKLNEIYRKEYSQRRESKKIIFYSTENDGIPYYDRRVEAIVLYDDGKHKVCVDKAFVKVLKPHQAEGIDFLFFTTIRSLKYIDDPGNGGILAHCMGLGKSLQVIAYLQTIFFDPIISKRISKGLLLVPTNVINNWERECTEKSSGDIHDNYLSAIEGWINSSRPSIIIVGYEMFRNLINFGDGKRNKMNSKKQQSMANKYCEYLQKCPHIVICDEAHRLKNISSKIASAVNEISTRRRICLTGTPIQNNLREYYTMINFVRPSLLGTYKEFSNQFVNPIEKGIKIGAAPHDVRLMKRRYVVLWKLLEHVVNRKDASFLYSTLPPKEEYLIYCSASATQVKLLNGLVEIFPFNNSCIRMKPVMSYICTHPYILKKVYVDNVSARIYDDQDNSDLENIDDKVKISEWLRDKCDSLKDIALNNFELSSKILILFDILRYAERVGDKVLVFVQYRETISYIEESLKYFAKNDLWYDECPTLNTRELKKNEFRKRTWELYKDYFIITGETSLQERSFIESRINMRRTKSTRPRLVLMTTKASSVGTNFIGANRVVLFESGFNPSDNLQALHRVYRIGQNKRTFVYRLITQGTIDQRVQEKHILKEGISKCSIDKHNIRDLYNDEDTRWNKIDCIDVMSPTFSRGTLSKPNDDLLSYLIFEEGLTDEEKEKEWNDYIEEQRRFEGTEFVSTFTNFPLNNEPEDVSLPFLRQLLQTSLS